MFWDFSLDETLSGQGFRLSNRFNFLRYMSLVVSGLTRKRDTSAPASQIQIANSEPQNHNPKLIAEMPNRRSPTPNTLPNRRTTDPQPQGLAEMPSRKGTGNADPFSCSPSIGAPFGAGASEGQSPAASAAETTAASFRSNWCTLRTI